MPMKDLKAIQLPTATKIATHGSHTAKCHTRCQLLQGERQSISPNITPLTATASRFTHQCFIPPPLAFVQTGGSGDGGAPHEPPHASALCGFLRAQERPLVRHSGAGVATGAECSGKLAFEAHPGMHEVAGGWHPLCCRRRCRFGSARSYMKDLCTVSTLELQLVLHERLQHDCGSH
jgi:hypothetical protein